MKVAVAIIVDEQNRILIAQRPLHASHGGRWEFPGGKLEPLETPTQALIREIKEEVDLTILESHPLGEIYYQYPNKTVELLVYFVSKFIGQATCLEEQLQLKWVEYNELNPQDFPEANQAIFPMIAKELECRHYGKSQHEQTATT